VSSFYLISPREGKLRQEETDEALQPLGQLWDSTSQETLVKESSLKSLQPMQAGVPREHVRYEQHRPRTSLLTEHTDWLEAGISPVP